MEGFSESELLSRLSALNNSAGSIQGLSLWLIHHRKHYKSIAEVWGRQLMQVNTDKKLTYVYLANDVVQNARKKSPELMSEFGNYMVLVFQHLAALEMSRKMVGSLGRVVSVWRERAIFEAQVIHEVSETWAEKLRSCQEEEAEPVGDAEPRLKRSKVDEEAVPPEGLQPELTGSEAACRASLELAQQLLGEVERAAGAVEECRDEGEVPRLVAGELVCRSRLAQLLAGVLAKQQEGVERAQERLRQIQDNR